VWAEANPALGDFLHDTALTEDARITPESAFRRYHLNQWTTTHSAWLPHGAWDAVADTARLFDPADPFYAFIDGSWSNDSTGMTACTIAKPHLSVLGHWTPDPTLGHIDMTAVERRVREVIAMPGFRGIGFDPFYLTDLFIRLEAELNLGSREMVIKQNTNSLSFMVPACQAFYTAVMDKSVTHDGDGRLAQHVRNAVLKEDRHGPRIVKEAKGSPRKIDLAVCAVGALSLSMADVKPDRSPSSTPCEPRSSRPSFAAHRGRRRGVAGGRFLAIRNLRPCGSIYVRIARRPVGRRRNHQHPGRARVDLHLVREGLDRGRACNPSGRSP
jgi:phage terminase large subunit-like protein